jgi:hypothetical protein
VVISEETQFSYLARACLHLTRWSDYRDGKHGTGARAKLANPVPLSTLYEPLSPARVTREMRAQAFEVFKYILVDDGVSGEFSKVEVKLMTIRA